MSAVPQSLKLVAHENHLRQNDVEPQHSSTFNYVQIFSFTYAERIFNFAKNIKFLIYRYLELTGLQG